MLIAWAAESAQFFIAQGFALAILAWLQTLPEFAVEAVLAWKQQVPLLLAESHRSFAASHRAGLADDLLRRGVFSSQEVRPPAPSNPAGSGALRRGDRLVCLRCSTLHRVVQGDPEPH